jgi:beta-lactamase class A
MGDQTAWSVAGVKASWCAVPIDGGHGGRPIGYRSDLPVTPASVMKLQVALTVAAAIDSGEVDGAARTLLGADVRTPGPVGMSLMTDPVEMSLRDLLVPMMTISDNVATDALIRAVGLDAVNATTDRLGLGGTKVLDDLRSMLDDMATEAGFADYAALVNHDSRKHGPPTDDVVRARLAASSALDPARGSRTTALDMVRLLSLIWTDAAGPEASCARIRWLMERQLTRHRIASGFGSGYTVAAKSGGLMGVVRNEIGVVTDPNGRSFAIAIFTRQAPGTHVNAGEIDAAIGDLARHLVDDLQCRSPSTG